MNIKLQMEYKINIYNLNYLKHVKLFLDTSECQFYQPYYSLYFNIHNTKNSSQNN